MGAFVLNIPQHKLRVVAPDVGGGFGVKQFHYAEEAVITWATPKIGRPINGSVNAAKALSRTRRGATT